MNSRITGINFNLLPSVSYKPIWGFMALCKYVLGDNIETQFLWQNITNHRIW